MDSQPDLTAIPPSVHRYLARVREMFSIDAAYLFGSYATGRQREESDIDLAIVSSDFSGIRFKDSGALGAMTWGIDTRIEPWGFRPEDFTDDHILPAEILRTGIRIDSLLKEAS